MGHTGDTEPRPSVQADEEAAVAAAIRDLEAGVPGSLETLERLARHYARAGRPDQAYRCAARLLRVARAGEERAAILLSLGALQEKMLDFARAAAHYRAALAQDPADPMVRYFAHNNLGFSLIQLARLEEAEPHLRTALALDPGRSNAYKNLGLCCYGQGLPEQAAEWFLSGIETAPDDPRSLWHLLELLGEHPEIRAGLPDFDARLAAARRAVERHLGEPLPSPLPGARGVH
jgi:tetratricopeptide (TPR) repeat protein